MKILCFLLLPGLFFAQDHKPAKDALVWAVDDTDKVHPYSGNLLSEGREVYAGKRPSQAAHRVRNSVWDAGSATVRLAAGRNEFVSFQLVVERRRDDLHKVFVTATDLIGVRERISADSNVRLFKQLYVEIGGEWYPDALLPFEIGCATPFDVAAGGPRAQAVWVDIYVPRGTPPGLYSGTVFVLHRNTNRQAAVKLELEVGGFTLPDELGIDVDLMNYGFLNVERGWPDVVLDSPRFRAIEREFFRLAHAHRMTFAIVPYNHDGSIPKGLKPELAGAGEGVRIASWKSWDERFGPLLSGEAFADQPRAGRPLDHFFLPHNLMWPSDIRNWRKPDYRTEHLRAGAEIRRHFSEKGWTRTQYQIYYNHKEHYNFFPWNLDEPTREQDLQALEYLGGILKESFPKDDPVKVLYRLDIGHFHCENVAACTHKRETGRQAIGRLGSLVDLWNINSEHFYPNGEETRKLKSMGKTLYFYSGTPRVDEPLAQAAAWGWRGYRHQADGICFWNATDWGDWDTDAPPGDPYTNAGGRYAGFSMLLYPGSKFGYDGPIPSIRLKAMRRGLQDFEYARLAEGSGKKSRAELAPVTDYPKARRELFAVLR